MILRDVLTQFFIVKFFSKSRLVRNNVIKDNSFSLNLGLVESPPLKVNKYYLSFH